MCLYIVITSYIGQHQGQRQKRVLHFDRHKKLGGVGGVTHVYFLYLRRVLCRRQTIATLSLDTSALHRYGRDTFSVTYLTIRVGMLYLAAGYFVHTISTHNSGEETLP